MALFSTRTSRGVLAAALVLAVGGTAGPALLLRERVFVGNPQLDAHTHAAPSRVPGAGQGLVATVHLAKGTVIAEMGGRLVRARDVVPPHRGYLFGVPACAASDVWPFDAMDGTQHGGLASKINFAPRTINGRATGLQNARGRTMCRRPYVYFEALRDLEPGEEIFASYGRDYDYDFMQFPEVQAHFCQVTGIDCGQGFTFEP